MRYGRTQDMNSFYICERGESGMLAQCTAQDVQHAYRVLRLNAGEAVHAIDPSGRRFEAVIEDISKLSCALRLGVLLPGNEPPIRFTLYQGIPKADKLELIAQKLTELGACRIVPVKMERSIAKFEGKDTEKKCERLQKIAREASKQCKRACAAQIAPPKALKQLIPDLQAHELLLVPWEDASGYALKKAHEQFPHVRDIAALIGPEGGIGPQEIELLLSIGARPVTLGPRILRTETAAIVTCALIMQLWGDIG